MSVTANILDPIHPGLDDRVFDNAEDPAPHLKARHRNWIQRTVHDALEKAGYENIDSWLSLVLTGSLTTYQYSEQSDVDVSLFVNADHLPDWSRAELIGVMVGSVDGHKLPGTPFPMQCFVVPPEITRQDLYRPGLRSGYDLDADEWIEPPDHMRVHDVRATQQGDYLFAVECADKMEKLLKYEPDRATQYWHQIHHRRQRDQKAGKGDFSQSNIVYKELANRGLFPEISGASGEYIAKVAVTTPWGQDHDEWSSARPSYDGQGHQLGYDPEKHQTGKGFVLEDGSVWTWPTHEQRPMHMEYDQRVKKAGQRVIPGSAFHLKGGLVGTYGPGRDAQKHIEAIQAADPRLSLHQVEPEWEFGA